MKKETSTRMERRRFCAGCAGLGALALVPGCPDEPEPATLPDADPPQQMAVVTHGIGLAAVVEVRWTRAVDRQGRVDGASVQAMLDAALKQLVGGDRPWSSWAGASRRISIKVNTITSQAFTHPEVAAGMACSLVAAGADPARVKVWDRDTAGLSARGYTIDKSGQGGFCCYGTDALPPGSRSHVTVAKNRVYLSPLLAESNVLFSVAALKDHSMAGVTLSLKNNFGMIYGADLLHGDVSKGSGCEPAISELAAQPEIKGRLGLAVIDALVGVCQGGPGEAQPEHVFRYGGLLLSRDPVALDRRGLAIIEGRRASLSLVPLARRTSPNPAPPVHIDNAAALGVGPG